MANSWEQIDIFPVIARIVTTSFETTPALVTHDTIVKALLSDAEAVPIIENARDQSPESQTAEWIASNMVAWFSQRITVGQSDWIQEFDREKIDGKWAYRPKAPLDA